MDFPGGTVAKTVLPMQAAQVQSVVRELKSYMQRTMAKKKKKRRAIWQKQHRGGCIKKTRKRLTHTIPFIVCRGLIFIPNGRGQVQRLR